jgi:cytochrome c oxidase subunit 2
MTRACWPLMLGVLAACGGGQHLDTSAAGAAAADSGAEQAYEGAQLIEIRASRWAYDPASITLRKDVPVILELHASDVRHGFNVPGLGLRADVLPDRGTRVLLTPKTPGTFPFHCDYYCGSGHESMAGQIIVE